MRCLLVSAHPQPNSLTHQIVSFCDQHLQTAGHVVVKDDLYDQCFDPVMSANEHQLYYNLESSPDELNSYVRRLQSAEAIVVVFPMWWFGPPAILKGWIDRVWAPGIAFEATTTGLVPKLSQLQKMILISTFNFDQSVNESLHHPFQSIVREVLLKKSAPEAQLLELMLYECSTLTEDRFQTFTSSIQRELDAL